MKNKISSTYKINLNQYQGWPSPFKTSKQFNSFYLNLNYVFPLALLVLIEKIHKYLQYMEIEYFSTIIL